MAWNEPGDQKPQDPWKRGSGQQNGGPPDLDEVLSNLFKRLSGLFGFKPSNPSQGNGSGKTLVVMLAGIGLLLWALSGFFIVNEAQQGVLMRLGQYRTALLPGWHWAPRFVDRVILVDTNAIRTAHTEGMMLTRDENIVEITLGVQYKVSNARQYLFSVLNVESSILQATDSALRYVIGHSNMDDVLTTGREQVRQLIWEQLEQIIDPYQMGIQILDVTLQEVTPPQQVQAAFDDAIKAQEDEERFINEAEAYSRKQEPIARGQAQRILQEAEAYRQQVKLNAQGDISKFEQLLPEYQKAPEVTRQRIYLATIEQIMGQTNKVLVEGATPVLYMPLDSKTTEPVKIEPAALTPLLPDPTELDSTSDSATPVSPIRRSDRFRNGGR